MSNKTDVEKERNYTEKFRSRYALFISCINNREYHVRRQFHREPSRIPVKKLVKIFHIKTKINQTSVLENS